MVDCVITSEELVNERLGRLLTQYRESPKLIHMIRTYLTAIADMHLQVCELPSYFDIENAAGDQLTIVGKRLGWPRCHCVCDIQPVFGFDCEGVIEDYTVAGFCDESVTWLNCGITGTGEICIVDDELYRKFLKVRIYQMRAFFDIESLERCLQILWGDEASVIASGFSRVVISPGRNLTNIEIALLQLYPRILPIALGVEVRFHFDKKEVFGFGQGWGGFCEPSTEADEIADNNQSYIVDENSEAITTGPLTNGAPWMCEINVNPHGC